MAARPSSQSITPQASNLDGRLLRERFGAVPYRLFVPTSASRDAGYPLIVFLHGGAGRGSDNSAHLREGNGMLIELLIRDTQADPAIVAAPQAGEEHSAAVVIGLVKDLIRQHRVDQRRVYIVGQSLGGLGVIAAVKLEPKMFAGAIIISATSEPGAADYLRQVPAWLFHGERDGGVSRSGGAPAEGGDPQEWRPYSHTEGTGG